MQDAKGGVTISNDGATILEKMKVVHPAAKMLVNLSKAQDVEAGDGTTSVVVLAGSLLEAAEKLLKKGIHPTSISEAFQRAAAKSVDILTNMATPVDLSDGKKLLQAANTSLNSKVVSQHSSELSPIAVNAVLKVIDKAKDTSVNLKDIKIIKKLGGTVDDTELIEGLILSERACGNVKKAEKAKIGLIQFQVNDLYLESCRTATYKVLSSFDCEGLSAENGHGQSGGCIRLRSDGSSVEGGEGLHPKHCQADQESWLQCIAHSEVDLA